MASQPEQAREKGRHETDDSVERLPVISVRGLRKQYQHRVVLDDFDLDIYRGETICVIGPSGSGKSTMLRCVNALETPDAGQILVEGVVAAKKGAELDRMRSRLGMVFQQFNLFPHMSVLRNVTVGLTRVRGMSKDEAREAAMRHLEFVGLTRLADSYPSQLSGGEQQRVAIARSLAMDPTMVLFDEPTSALDPELVRGVLTLIGRLAEEGLTMLVVSHEMGFARQAADRVLFMDGGRLIEQGTPEQIFDDPQTQRLKTFLAQVL